MSRAEAPTKPSGIPWLGEVPAHWEVKRLRYLVEKIGSGKTPKGGAESYPLEGIIFIRSQNVYDNGLRLDDVVFIDEEMDEDMSSTRVRPNDVLLNITGASIGRSARVPDDLGPANVNQHVAIIRPSRSLLDQGFLHAFLCSQATKAAILADEVGSSREALNSDQISALTLPLPPFPEQRAIAAFLDERTVRIDALIARKQRLVQLLKEKRQALITRAVTRGLDATVKLKQSGVPWLGEVPEHWGVKPLRHIGTFQNGISEGADYFGSGYPFVSYGDVYQGATLPLEVEGLANSTETDRLRYSVQQGDVLFTRTSETNEEIGFASTCIKTIENGAFSGFVIRMRPRKNMLVPDFSKHYFRSDVHRAFFVKEMNLVTRASLGQDLLKRLPVLLPPLREQETIAEFIDDRTTRIDALITKVEQAVLRLQEYRTALISAAVTGKVRVPNTE